MVDYIKSFDNSNEYDNYKSSPLYVRPNVSYIWDKGIVRTDIVAQSGASGTFPNLKGGCLFENAVMDYDGNIYDAVVLGDQVWLGSNLRTTHYADGTPIDEMEYFVVSASGFTSIECGIAYRRIAVLSGYTTASTIQEGWQGISPDGWHIPSSGEVWTMLQWLRDEYNISKNSSGYYYDAPPLCSNHGWKYGSYNGSVGHNQQQNNRANLNLVPLGNLSGGDVFEMVTYNMTQDSDWDWEGEYIIVVENSNKKYYVMSYINPTFFGGNNVLTVAQVSNRFTNNTCLYDEPGGLSNSYNSGDESFMIEKINNKYVIRSKFCGFYFSPNYENIEYDGFGHDGVTEFSTGVLFSLSINQNDNSVNVYNDSGLSMRYYPTYSYCTFVNDDFLNNNDTRPVWLYKRIKNPSISQTGEFFKIMTTDVWSTPTMYSITTNYNNIYITVSPNNNSLFSVRCLYNGTVEEFIKNYRNLNP